MPRGTLYPQTFRYIWTLPRTNPLGRKQPSQTSRTATSNHGFILQPCALYVRFTLAPRPPPTISSRPTRHNLNQVKSFSLHTHRPKFTPPALAPHSSCPARAAASARYPTRMLHTWTWRFASLGPSRPTVPRLGCFTPPSAAARLWPFSDAHPASRFHRPAGLSGNRFGLPYSGSPSCSPTTQRPAPRGPSAICGMIRGDPSTLCNCAGGSAASSR